MTHREKDLFYETLIILRIAVSLNEDFRGADWKDVDDYIFSTLSFTKAELLDIFDGRNSWVYIDSAESGCPPCGLDYDTLKLFMDARIPLRREEIMTQNGEHIPVIRTVEPVPRILLTFGDTARLAEIPFGENVVLLPEGERPAISFMRMNPDGTHWVPFYTVKAECCL